LADLVPALRGLVGGLNGGLTLAPATDPRAISPLRLIVNVDPKDARYKTIDVGAIRLSAFMNLDSRFVLQRIVLDELPDEDAAERKRTAQLDEGNVPPAARPLDFNDIRIAGGRLKLWARRGRHPSGVEQTHIIADFDDLDLDQLLHAVNPNERNSPGKLSGELIVHGDPQDLNSIIGTGRLSIARSDLGEIAALKLLYDTMSLGSQPKEPNGTGTLSLALEGSTLTLNNIHYFNRGAEAWSNNLTISDIFDAPHSPMSGFVVGSARPLTALKLPLLADVDQILSVLQSNLTTVRINGTIANPDVRTATFSDVGSGLKQFLTGQVNESRR